MRDKDRISKLENDLVVADRVNGKLIRKLVGIYDLVTGPIEDDNEVRYQVLLALESESNLTLGAVSSTMGEKGSQDEKRQQEPLQQEEP